MKAIPDIQFFHHCADHAVTTMVNQSEKLGRPRTCPGLGCAACCYEPVYVERREVEHALGRLTPQDRKLVKLQLIEWLAKVEPSGLLNDCMPNGFKWRDLRAPCPFLRRTGPGKNGYQQGQCMIYQDRPLGCRLHNACGPVESCYDDEARKHQLYITAKEITAYMAGAMVQLFKTVVYDNLGVFLAETLLHRTVTSGSYEKATFKVDAEGNLVGGSRTRP
jgi:Fe-S-cluster containining protein